MYRVDPLQLAGETHQEIEYRGKRRLTVALTAGLVAMGAYWLAARQEVIEPANWQLILSHENNLLAVSSQATPRQAEMIVPTSQDQNIQR